MWLPFAINLLPSKFKATVFGSEIPIQQSDTVSWWNGSAQSQFEQNLMQQSVARTYLLRVRNQYQYSLFGKINAHNIYQFGDCFFRFYAYGFNEDMNFIGQEKLKAKITALKKLQNYLGDSIPIITLIAPNKLRYYPEKIPYKNRTQTPETNYNYVLKYLKENKLHFIDYNDYFIRHKSTCPAIFANGGTHWTHYAATVAMDSLVRYIAALKQKEFNSFSFEVNANNGFNVDDLDIALLRNLFTKPKDTNIREVKLHSKQNKPKINAVIVGDSYFLAVQNTGVRKMIFSNNTAYHYYFRTTYDKDYNAHPINFQKIKQQLKQADCVILITGTINMEIFGFGFAEKMLALP
jgi:hypothetical protein